MAQLGQPRLATNQLLLLKREGSNPPPGTDTFSIYVRFFMKYFSIAKSSVFRYFLDSNFDKISFFNVFNFTYFLWYCDTTVSNHFDRGLVSFNHY